MLFIIRKRNKATNIHNKECKKKVNCESSPMIRNISDCEEVFLPPALAYRSLASPCSENVKQQRNLYGLSMIPQVTLNKYVKSLVFYRTFPLGNAFLFLRGKIKAKARFHKDCAFVFGPTLILKCKERQIVSFYNSNTSVRNSKDMNRKI